jgi:hypothetical protein
MRAARTIVNAEELIAAIRDNSDLDDLAHRPGSLTEHAHL